MAENLRTIDFWYGSNYDQVISVGVVELGDRQWNGFNTQPFTMSGTWDHSWADDTHTYDQLAIDPTDNLRTLDVGNIANVNLKANPNTAKSIYVKDRISDLVGFKYFSFSNFGSYDPSAVAECNVSNNHYSAIYLAHAKVGEDEYIGFLGWNTDPNNYYYHKPMFIVNEEFSNWLMIYTKEPGDTGFIPTLIKYVHDKLGIGGKGHKTDPGNLPAYDTDNIDNPDAPDESSASAIGSGLIHAYDINTANLGALATVLYGTTLGGLITNLSINPLDFIISLNIFPTAPSHATASTNLVLGKWVCTDSGIDSLGGNVSGKLLTSQFKVVHFGKVNIEENWGSFLDYSHTQIELYLPFIGTVDIDTSEVMNGSIDLDYTIDFFTGMCVANVNCNRVVELPNGRTKIQKSQHSFQGNCAISVPLSQQQYGNMIGSLINAGTAGLKGGIAGMGITVASDIASGGFKPTVTTKGTISANAGFCSILYPYVRITRPISAISDSFQEVNGFPSYINNTLGECTDLCVCDNIDLHSITGATDSEIERIRQMCLEGVHV